MPPPFQKPSENERIINPHMVFPIPARGACFSDPFKSVQAGRELTIPISQLSGTRTVNAGRLVRINPPLF